MLHPLVTCALVANVGAFAYTTVSGLSFDSVAEAYLSKVRTPACLVISLPETSTGILIVPHKASQSPMDVHSPGGNSLLPLLVWRAAFMPNMGRRDSRSGVLPVW